MKEGYKETTLGEIPVEWNIVKINDIADVNKDSLPNKTDSEYEFYYIDLASVKSGEIQMPDEKIKFSSAPSRARRILKSGDVIMATVRPNLLGYAYANFDTKEYVCSTGFALISNKENSDGQFIYQNLYSKNLQSQINKLIVGSNYPAINSTDVQNLELPLPPLPEQQKIASILSTVDDKIEVIDQQIATTQQLKKGLMQRLLTKGIGHTKFKDSALGEIPESWEVVKLGELVFKVGSGITPKGGQAAYLEDGITFIRSQNVLRGKLKLDDVAYISDEQHHKMKNSQLKAGDVLLNITGASIGRSCVLPSSLKEGNVNQHVCIIRNKEELNSDYLSQLLNSEYGKNQIDKFQAGGNREGLNFQQIKSFLIPFPLQQEQQKIASILRTVDEKLEVLADKKSHYQELKKGLMQQLLTGKVRVKV